MPDLLTEQRCRLEAVGQGHVLRFVDELDMPVRKQFLEQVASADIELVARLFGDLVRSGKSEAALPPADELTPAPFVRLPDGAPESLRKTKAWAAGEDVLRKGQVACLMVAGGQGTRLGFEGPKGAFPIGPVTKRTLFQMQTEKVLAARRRYDVAIPFYLMVSRHNREATEEFFRGHDFFQMPEEDVVFFEQVSLPAVDENGRILLEDKDRLFLSPNGHGGTIKALSDGGVLDDMRRRGIEHISYFQVDNPLVRSVDPYFLGLHVRDEAEMSLKILRKKDPFEKVGNVVAHKGVVRIIEYSDLPEELAVLGEPDGGLRFRLGSIAIHAFTVDFLERMAARSLPYHVAHKKISFVGEDGAVVEPEKENGYKFEMFIFDALAESGRTMVAETNREFEFSPVKNAEGPSSPDTSRRDLSRFYVRMFERAGIKATEAAAPKELRMEVSPLCGMDGEELKIWLRESQRQVALADGFALRP